MSRSYFRRFFVEGRGDLGPGEFVAVHGDDVVDGEVFAGDGLQKSVRYCGMDNEPEKWPVLG